MATLTLKNVPDDLYAALKEAAANNRRSLNQEAIDRLVRSASQQRLVGETRLDWVRRNRPQIPPEKQATMEEVDQWKREGRE